MSKKYKTDKSYWNSWYALTVNRLLVTLGTLKGEINCDVCVIGGGFTGISAALELAQKGMSVVLLEKDELGAGGAGKNGGHVLRGFNKPPSEISARYGADDAKHLCNMTLEGLGLILERITQHDIKCDLKFGHLIVATKARNEDRLKKYRDEWARIGHTDMEFISRAQVQDKVRGAGYQGGLYDPKGAHIHPLNYALGVAQAAQKAGCKIHDHTEVLEVKTENGMARVMTERAQVNAKFAILAGAVSMKGAKPLRRKTLFATADMIATEPLNDRIISQIMPADIAVAENKFVLNYFRRSADNRLLFGGNCNYGSVNLPGKDHELRKLMLSVFPQLKMTAISHCWRGPMEFTANRLPHIGRLSPQVYFAHGFEGLGIILTNLSGRLLAEAIAGQAGRFDVFAKIRHTSIPGGGLLRRPLFTLGMAWYQLRDLL